MIGGYGNSPVGENRYDDGNPLPIDRERRVQIEDDAASQFGTDAVMADIEAREVLGDPDSDEVLYSEEDDNPCARCTKDSCLNSPNSENTINGGADMAGNNNNNQRPQPLTRTEEAKGKHLEALTAAKLAGNEDEFNRLEGINYLYGLPKSTDQRTVKTLDDFLAEYRTETDPIVATSILEQCVVLTESKEDWSKILRRVRSDFDRDFVKGKLEEAKVDEEECFGKPYKSMDKDALMKAWGVEDDATKRNEIWALLAPMLESDTDFNNALRRARNESEKTLVTNAEGEWKNLADANKPEEPKSHWSHLTWLTKHRIISALVGLALVALICVFLLHNAVPLLITGAILAVPTVGTLVPLYFKKRTWYDAKSGKILKLIATTGVIMIIGAITALIMGVVWGVGVGSSDGETVAVTLPSGGNNNGNNSPLPNTPNARLNEFLRNINGSSDWRLLSDFNPDFDASMVFPVRYSGGASGREINGIRVRAVDNFTLIGVEDMAMVDAIFVARGVEPVGDTIEVYYLTRDGAIDVAMLTFS